MTRYSSANTLVRRRILCCLGNPFGSINWIHGNWADFAGATFYNGNEITFGFLRYTISPNTNWAVTCGRNLLRPRSDGTIVKGVRSSFATGGSSKCALGINLIPETSEWQVSKVYKWNKHLSDSAFALVSSSLYNALSPNTPVGVRLSCPVNSQSAAGAAMCECRAGSYAMNIATPSVCPPLCLPGSFNDPEGRVCAQNVLPASFPL